MAACSSPSIRISGKQSAHASPKPKSMLDMMKNCKPPRVVGSRDSHGTDLSAVKAIKLSPREIIKLVTGKEELMLIREFNIRAICVGAKVAVVFGGTMPSDDDVSSKSTKVLKVWPVLGFMTFAGNVTLTEDNYASYMDLFGSMSSESPMSYEDFVQKSRPQSSKSQRIGWHFHKFTLHENGLQLVPSTGGNQDCTMKISVNLISSLNY